MYARSTSSNSTAIASRLAPTGDLRCMLILQPPLKTVGARLLAMAAAQSKSPVTDTPLSRAGSLPQGICGGCESCGHPEKTVGASLLAMATARSKTPVADTPLSRASPLQQGICGGCESCGHPKKTVGASLLAMATALSKSPVTDPPLSRASSLPQGILSFAIELQKKPAV